MAEGPKVLHNGLTYFGKAKFIGRRHSYLATAGKYHRHLVSWNCLLLCTMNLCSGKLIIFRFCSLVCCY